MVEGNRYRFRRMFFNLIMNAVDALKHKRVGVIEASAERDGDHVTIRVRDSGRGMAQAKIDQLLADPETLDGELHSLGFVFVRQTIGAFGGKLVIESVEDVGTTMCVRLPHLGDAEPSPHASSEWAAYGLAILGTKREERHSQAVVERILIAGLAEIVTPRFL